MIDDVAYSASCVKRKKKELGGDGVGSGIRGGKKAGGEGESRLGGFLGALRGPTRGFKGVLDVDVAEARKARQLGSTAGCQNLCPLPPPHPNRTTTYTPLPSSFLRPPRRAHSRLWDKCRYLLRVNNLDIVIWFLINWIISIKLYSILILH